jgi:hypothetical protein
VPVKELVPVLKLELGRGQRQVQKPGRKQALEQAQGGKQELELAQEQGRRTEPVPALELEH